MGSSSCGLRGRERYLLHFGDVSPILLGMEHAIQTQPRHFWKQDVELACVAAGVGIDWLRERFEARMGIWYNAGETVRGAVDMILFTWKQEPVEVRKDSADLGPIRRAVKA